MADKSLSGFAKRRRDEKAFHCILFLSQFLKYSHDTFDEIYKVYYVANILHLAEYGREIVTFSDYIAMPNFPMSLIIRDEIMECITTKKFQYHPIETKFIRENLNKDYLSESDMECMLEAIYFRENHNDFDGYVRNLKSLKVKRIGENISLRDVILLDVENGKEVLDYMNS